MQLTRNGVAPCLAVMLTALPVQAKVTNPLQGILRPEMAKAKPGSTVDFTLEFSSTVAFAAVEVALKTSTGLTLVSGTQSVVWRDIVPKARRTLRFRLRVDARGEQHVEIVARVLGLEGATVSRVFLATVNATSVPSPAPTVKTDAQGNSYRVQDLPSSPPAGR
jgi:hypothetical protein